VGSWGKKKKEQTKMVGLHDKVARGYKKGLKTSTTGPRTIRVGEKMKKNRRRSEERLRL